MKNVLAIAILLACITLSGCDKHREGNKPKPQKPPAGDVQKVPDAPSNLQLSAIAAAAIAAYAVSVRKERDA
jgi:hypothetical protein